jgi:FecR-like protein/putative zinc finger protein
MDDVQLLISGYLDGELTNEEREQLARALERDGSSLDQLVYDGFIHSQLLDWMNKQRVPELTSSSTTVNAGDPTSRSTQRAKRAEVVTKGQVWPANAFASSETSPQRSRLWSLTTLAATLLVAGSVSIAAYIYATRPVIVAQLTQATGSRWDDTNTGLGVGSLLQDGEEMKLVKGTALVTFSSGTRLLLEAPVALRLDSAMEVHLHYGRIAARVPTTARGFTITSPLAQFVDLGTAFTLNLVADKSFELHVFEGLVELQLDERFGDAVHQPLRVAEVRAVSFDIKSGDVKAVEFQEGKQMPF